MRSVHDIQANWRDISIFLEHRARNCQFQVDSTELMAMASADLRRTHAMTIVGVDNRIQAEKWSFRDWKDLAVLGAMMAVLMDPMQNISISWSSRKDGGCQLMVPLSH